MPAAADVNQAHEAETSTAGNEHHGFLLRNDNHEKKGFSNQKAEKSRQEKLAFRAGHFFKNLHPDNIPGCLVSIILQGRLGVFLLCRE